LEAATQSAKQNTKDNSSQAPRITNSTVVIILNILVSSQRAAGKLAQFLENWKGGSGPEAAGVPIRDAVVSIMGFPVYVPFAAPLVFRWLFSSHFRMASSDLDRGEAVRWRFPANRSATPRTIIA